MSGPHYNQPVEPLAFPVGLCTDIRYVQLLGFQENPMESESFSYHGLQHSVTARFSVAYSRVQMSMKTNAAQETVIREP